MIIEEAAIMNTNSSSQSWFGWQGWTLVIGLMGLIAAVLYTSNIDVQKLVIDVRQSIAGFVDPYVSVAVSQKMATVSVVWFSACAIVLIPAILTVAKRVRSILG